MEDLSDWTVVKLKQELRRRNLPVSGRKSELIERLSDGFVVQTAEKVKVKKETKISAKITTKRKPVNNTELSFLKEPIMVLKYFILFVWRHIKEQSAIKSNWRVLAAITLPFSIFLVDNSKLSALFNVEIHLVEYYRLRWFDYFEWIVLGIMSSIGLGTGAHTFVLFLAPFIAKVSALAYECNSLDFAVVGANAFKCKPGTFVDFFKIADKVKWECFFWGLGTAIGELPPYLIARASALAGKYNSDIDQITILKGKDPKSLNWNEWGQIKMHGLLEYAGFWGILLCASIPNPLFDLAGITCGYFLVPFYTFFFATFIGKAVIKSVFVLFLFSKSTLDTAISYAMHLWPSFGEFLHVWIYKQKDTLQHSKSGPINALSLVWNSFLFVMISYFVVSILESFAQWEYKRELEQIKKE